MQYTPSKPGIMSVPRNSKLVGLMRWGVVAIAALGVAGCEHPTPVVQPFIGVLPQGSFQVGDWVADLDLGMGDRITRVDVREKLVYVYTQSKRVSAFDRAAGTLKFSMDVKSSGEGLIPLVELKDLIVFPTPTAFQVFDAHGVFLRSVPLPSPLRSNAAGEGTSIFFGSVGPRGGLVEAYDISRPYAPQKWEYLTRDEASVVSGPAISGGIIYSGSEAGEVDAVSTSETRAQVWDTEHGAFLAAGAIVADLQIDDSGLYISSRDSKMYCVKGSTGKLLWQYFAGAPLNEPVALTSDMVYQYVPGKGIAALDKATVTPVTSPMWSPVTAYDRSPRWINSAARQFLSQDEKYAYLLEPRTDPDKPDAAPMNFIIAVDKQTGVQAFSSKRSDFTVFGVNHKDSTIYAGFGDGKIMTIKPVLKAGAIGELVMTPVQGPAVAAGVSSPG